MTNPTTEESLLSQEPAHAPESEPVLLEGGALTVEHEPESEPVRFTMSEAPAPVASRGNSHLWFAGAGLVLLGAGLAGAPHVSVKAGRLLAPLGAPELYGGLLIVAGLGLFIGGVLRRSLTGIRSALADLSAETSRLDQVSHDTQILCSTVDQVQASNEESKTALASLQKRIERLTEIASDPDHTVSMFRLAASVDQLGARLDLFIKDQFKNMNQQLGGAVGQAQQIERNLIGRLDELGSQVGTQLGEQLTAQRQALTEGFERTAASTARASSGIEANLTAAARMEAQLAEHKQALSSAVQSLSAGQQKAADRTETRLAEHKQSLGQAVDSLASGQVKAAERVETRLAEHKKALAVAVESLAAEQVKAVVHIEGRFAEQQQALGSTVESLSADQLKATAALHDSLSELGARFEQHLQEQTTYVAECLGQLGGTLESSGRERDTLTREVATRLEQQVAEQSRGLHQDLAPLAEAARRSAQTEERMHATLAELETTVGAQVQNLQLALAEGLAQLGGTLERSGREHDTLTREVATRLEQQLHEQATGLEQDLAPLAEAASRSAQTEERLHALLAELETTVGAQVQNLQLTLADGLGQLGGTLERSGRERDTLTREVATRLEQQVTEQSRGLHQELAPLAEAASRSAQTEERLHALLAELESHVGAQVQNLQLAMAEGLERTRLASSETYEAATEGLQAAARLESRVHECQENLSRAFASTREDWKNGLGQLGGAMEREVKSGHERNSQSVAVTKRIEIEIAANSSRLERIADELRGLASLALEIRDARQDVPAPACSCMDPPPALPMQRDTPSDVIP